LIAREMSSRKAASDAAAIFPKTAPKNCGSSRVRSVTRVTTLAQFGSNFGLSTLVGKPLAFIADARLDGRTSTAVIERLLSISGEDALDVDRKNLPPIVGTRLRTLLMILTNETPKFADESGAIANRFVVLQLTKSFLGAEDTGLAEVL